MNGRRAITLAETLVVSTVMVVLIGVIAHTLQPGLAAWRRSEVRSDLQGNALISMHAVQTALAASTGSNVRIYGGTAVAVASTTVANHVDVYFVRTRAAELWTAGFDATPSPSPTPSPSNPVDGMLPPAVLSDLLAGNGVPPGAGQQKRVGRYIASLQIAPAPSGFRVVVNAALAGYTSHVETAVTPTLQIFTPQTPP